MTDPTVNVPAPGWYADPEVPEQVRWWDGAVWTTNVAPNPTLPEAFSVPENAAASEMTTPAEFTDASVPVEDPAPLPSRRSQRGQGETDVPVAPAAAPSSLYNLRPSTYATQNRNTVATVSLVFGLVSLIINPVLLYLGGVVAIVLGAIGIARANAFARASDPPTGRTKAIVGLILGIVATAAWIGVTFFLFGNQLMGMVALEQPSNAVQVHIAIAEIVCPDPAQFTAGDCTARLVHDDLSSALTP